MSIVDDINLTLAQLEEEMGNLDPNSDEDYERFIQYFRRKSHIKIENKVAENKKKYISILSNDKNEDVLDVLKNTFSEKGLGIMINDYSVDNELKSFIYEFEYEIMVISNELDLGKEDLEKMMDDIDYFREVLESSDLICTEEVSKDFLSKIKKYVSQEYWQQICARNPIVDEEFGRKYPEVVDWDYFSTKPLDSFFLLDFHDRVNWYQVGLGRYGPDIYVLRNCREYINWGVIFIDDCTIVSYKHDKYALREEFSEEYQKYLNGDYGTDKELWEKIREVKD